MRDPIFFEELDRTVVDTNGVQRHNTFSYPYHLHPHTEFFVILEGEMTLLAGEEHVLKAGDAVLISPLVIHGYRSDGTVTFCSMVFEDPLFFDVPRMEEFGAGSCICFLDTERAFPDGELKDVLRAVLRYRQRNHRLLLTLYCRILLTLVLECAYAGDGRCRLTSAGGRDPVEQVVNDERSISAAVLPYIRAHYREKITLNDLARTLRSNRYTVSRLLNESFDGITINRSEIYREFTEVYAEYREQEAHEALEKEIEGLCDRYTAVFRTNLSERFPGILPSVRPIKKSCCNATLIKPDRTQFLSVLLCPFA